MNPIIKPWPFKGWGMDMIGKINPPSSRGHQFILAITDYFTKWVEAVPMKSVTSRDVISFVKEHVFIGSGFLRPLQQMEGWCLYLMNSKSSLPTWGLN
jgi:hypothetical protein